MCIIARHKNNVDSFRPPCLIGIYKHHKLLSIANKTIVGLKDIVAEEKFFRGVPNR